MSSKSYIIGLAGGSGSGKTSFINELKKEYDSTQVCFISLDDYYHDREDQVTDDAGIKNFDLPDAIKADALLHDIKAIQKGETITKEKYVFNNALAKTEEITLQPAPIMVIEGLYVYHYEELKDFFDLKLFIDSKEELKLIRRIKRDQIERNYPLEDVIYRYEHHVMPSYRKHIQIYKDSADLIINNSEHFKNGLEVVKTFINSKL